jgi:hypothetical protein
VGNLKNTEIMRYKSYHHQHKNRLIISWKEYGRIVKDLAKKVEDRFTPDCIIGNSKGGCIIGGTIAAILRKDFYPMRISRRKNDKIVFKKPKLFVPPPNDILDKKVLLVDDLSGTGETFKIAKKILEKKKPKEIKILSLARHRKSFRPDFCGLSSNACIVFPWDRWVYENGKFKLHPELIIKK